MFKNLTNFGYQRTTKEAIGFYLTYLFLTMIVSMLLGGVLALALVIQPSDNFDFGLRVGNVIAVIVSLGVSFLVLKEKKLLGSFGFILLALFAGLLAIYIGALGGLIPAAYLTTKPTSTK